MDIERFNQRKQQYKKSLEQLKTACAEKENMIVRDSVIKRFELTYELAWKVLKLWLENKGIDVRNPKDTLKEAYVQNLIADGDDWMRLHESRNLTSHTYDQDLAEKIYHFIKTNALPLFETLLKRLDSESL